jgi:hypothetical protein
MDKLIIGKCGNCLREVGKLKENEMTLAETLNAYQVFPVVKQGQVSLAKSEEMGDEEMGDEEMGDEEMDDEEMDVPKNEKQFGITHSWLDAHPEGADREGADREGADREGADREGADREGADREGADREGADRAGYIPWVFVLIEKPQPILSPWTPPLKHPLNIQQLPLSAFRGHIKQIQRYLTE